MWETGGEAESKRSRESGFALIYDQLPKQDGCFRDTEAETDAAKVNNCHLLPQTEIHLIPSGFLKHLPQPPPPAMALRNRTREETPSTRYSSFRRVVKSKMGNSLSSHLLSDHDETLERKAQSPEDLALQGLHNKLDKGFSDLGEQLQQLKDECHRNSSGVSNFKVLRHH